MIEARGYGYRKFVNAGFRAASGVAVLLALLPLVSVLYFTAARGLGGVNLAFFTELPKPVGEAGGGMANALSGTLKIVAMACGIGLPIGVLAGVFLSEFRQTGFATAVRFSADVMSGIPSITIGMVVYTVVVRPMGHFSAFAGSVALAIIMLPTVTRTTEELLRLVPGMLREAAFGLGMPKWRATLLIVLRTAAPGIVTGAMLAIARITGETAPLLFTAFNNRFWGQGIDQPVASLPVQIYTYAVSPYEDWHRQAWAAAFVLVMLTLLLNLTAKFLVRNRLDAR
ncbi:MAG TPA: phosphate ABC transporter permease PstA [Polyangiaceae bacterium]|jgi:phosphate transport system permease protein|nr:phosphate ABC transporter permease PstA [Polyangiaceae bacterium]